METGLPQKTDDDATTHIKSLRCKLTKQLDLLESSLQTVISKLPKFMVYILDNILSQCKLNNKPSSTALEYNLAHLEFIGDCLKDEFNTGHWKNCDIDKRKAFTISSALKVSSRAFIHNLRCNVIFKKERHVDCRVLGTFN